MATKMFGHAASRWGSHQAENLATSALVYLLNTYDAAASAFVASVGALTPGGASFGDDLRFVEQLVADGSSIDAAGIGRGNERRILIECKFGAVLGDGQITRYLEELSTSGVLMFIVPCRRKDETTEQVCKVLDLPPGAFNDRDGFRFAHHDQKSVAITDWMSVLDTIGKDRTDVEFVAELNQLESYVDLMTGDGFIALEREELAGRAGIRWRQFTELFEEAVKAARAAEYLETEGILKASHGYSGRGLRIGSWVVWGGVWAHAWADTADTPLWLQVTGGAGRPDAATALNALQGLRHEGQPRALERNKEVVVPLYLKCAVDRAEVVTDLVAQLAAVRAAVDAAAMRDGAEPPSVGPGGVSSEHAR